MSQITSNPYLCTGIMSAAYGLNGAMYSGSAVNSQV